MLPVLFNIGDLRIPSYAVFLALAFGVGFWVRHIEKRRLGWQARPAQRYISVAALLGAVVGSKIGMIFFLPPDVTMSVLAQLLVFDFTGKTVVGALIGGYLSVELAKKALGIKEKTGDAFAVAIPLGQGIGRMGCFLHGCCFGRETPLPWGVFLEGTMRHPVQLYEGALDFLLAALLWATRRTSYPQGHLFRRYILGYACIRFFTEFFRADPALYFGGLSVVQWISLTASVCFGWIVYVGFRDSRAGSKDSPFPSD